MNKGELVSMSIFGFIGYGSMGSMLVKEFIQIVGIEQRNIIVTRKNENKLKEITDTWPDINVTPDITEVAKKSKYLFLCVKPLEMFDILEKISPYLLPKQHLISICAAVRIQDIERFVNCNCSKLLPTVVSEVQRGVTLICHSARVQEEEAQRLEEILSRINIIKRVEEKNFGFASELTSCGPGFYAEMLKEFINAGLRCSDCFSIDEIAEMVQETVLGTIELAKQKKISYGDIITRVATKGGITEEGVMVMRKELPQVFDGVFRSSMDKRAMVDHKLKEQIDNRVPIYNIENE